MSEFDVFNGDADGLCAIHQLRLAEPAAATVVTGVKRDVQLLAGLTAAAGDRVTVCDISLDSNRADLLRLLQAGVSVRWFDHHHAGDIPADPLLDAHIDEARDVCTSLLVDRFLGHRHQRWAIAAAFGDNLTAVAFELGAAAGLSAAELARLRALGENLNYNAYGDEVGDLLVPPAELLALMRGHEDPLLFVAGSDELARIDAGRRGDLARGLQVTARHRFAHGDIVVLPDAPWSRRVRGTLGNELAGRDPERAQAILTPDRLGGYVVSVRLPHHSSGRADTLCRAFDGGGGRAIAAGINHLPAAELRRFVDLFAAMTI